MSFLVGADYSLWRGHALCEYVKFMISGCFYHDHEARDSVLTRVLGGRTQVLKYRISLQWFSNSSVYQKLLVHCKRMWLGPIPECLIQEVWVGMGVLRICIATNFPSAVATAGQRTVLEAEGTVERTLEYTDHWGALESSSQCRGKLAAPF